MRRANRLPEPNAHVAVDVDVPGVRCSPARAPRPNFRPAAPSDAVRRRRSAHVDRVRAMSYKQPFRLSNRGPRRFGRRGHMDETQRRVDDIRRESGASSRTTSSTSTSRARSPGGSSCAAARSSACRSRSSRSSQRPAAADDDDDAREPRPDGAETTAGGSPAGRNHPRRPDPADHRAEPAPRPGRGRCGHARRDRRVPLLLRRESRAPAAARRELGAERGRLRLDVHDPPGRQVPRRRRR